MLYFFRLIFLSINIDQETVLNWFGIENPNSQSNLLPIVFHPTNLICPDI